MQIASRALAAFHPKKPNILASCSSDETINIWDVTSESCLSTLTCGSRVESIAFKDNMLAAACGSGEIKTFSHGQSGDLGGGPTPLTSPQGLAYPR